VARILSLLAQPTVRLLKKAQQALMPGDGYVKFLEENL